MSSGDVSRTAQCRRQVSFACPEDAGRQRLERVDGGGERLLFGVKTEKANSQM